jgi:hypothetical protein
MAVLIFILLIPFNSIARDYLLEAMFANWNDSDLTFSDSNTEKSDYSESGEAEFYSWELGQPDNIPEIEIIYDDPSPCQL